MAQVHLAHALNLLVGVIHILHLINEPSVAVGVWVLHRHGLTALQRHDEVLGVEHVQYREHAVSIYLGHVAASFSHRLHRLLHLWSDVSVYHLLITAKFGCVITTDALMIIRSLVLIEGVRCEIQYTIVECLVTTDNLVGLGHLLRSVTLGLVNKHIIVEITLVHHPHIHQAEHGDTGNHEFLAQLLVLVEHQEGRADDDNPERAPAIRGKDSLANLHQVAHDRALVFGRQLLQRLHLLYGDEIWEEYARHDGKEQAETCGQAEASIYIFYLSCQYLRFIHDLLQSHHRQQRNGKLGDDEDGCHRTELGVHRHVIQEEIGKRHEVSTPG